MKYPAFLKEGDRIGLVAPSFGCTTEPYLSRLKKAVKRFKKWGYQVEVGPNCLMDRGVGKSNTPEACGEEINEFFLNDKADVIISVGGGETMCEDLPYINFGAIKVSKPIWYMGFSDNTNLTFTLPTLCDTAAIYGPCAGGFGTKPIDPNVKDAFKILTGKSLKVSNYEKWEREGSDTDDPYAGSNMTEPFSMQIHAGGKNKVEFSGRLIGGCLDCLVTLCGTQFDKAKEFCEKYEEDGIIWFLEACDLNPMAIRRALWQLDQAGWFTNVKGFIIGRSLHYDEVIMGVDRLNAYTDALEKFDVPILLDVDLGHLAPSMPLIAGAVADVKATKGKGKGNDRLKIKMHLV